MTTINKENSIVVLINSVRLGQKMGAYILREVKLLKQAIDYFNPDVKEKPTFDNAENPEIVAINLLLQGVQKAQAHGGEYAFSIDDAAFLWDIMEFWIKEGGKGIAQNVNINGTTKEKNGKSAKSAAASLRTIRTENGDDEEDEEEDEDATPLITNSYRRKGKERVEA